MNKLLNKVPTNIQLGYSGILAKAARKHSTIVNFLGINFSFWVILTFLSEFPVTFSGPAHETKVLPDYGTGTYYTVNRVRDRFYSKI